MISTWTKRDAASGIVFIVLVVATIIISGEPPAPSDSAADIGAYFVDNRGRLLAAAFLTGLALIPFLWFAAVLRSVLRRWGDDAERLASLSFGAAVAAGVLQLAGVGIQAMLAYDAGRAAPRYVADAPTVTALFDIGTGVVFMGLFALVIFVAAASLVMLRTRALPAWLGWLGLAVALVNLLSYFVLFVDPDDAGGVVILGLVAFVLFLVWVLAASIVLMRLDDRAGHAATAGT